MILEKEINAYTETLREMLNKLGQLGYAHGTQQYLNLDSRDEIAEKLVMRAKIEDLMEVTINQIYQIGYEDGENYATCLPYTAHFSSPGASHYD